jgi:hypothetical protein
MLNGTGKVGSISPDAIGAFLLPQKWVLMTDRPALYCDLHSYGHSPHFIQARKAWEGQRYQVKVRYLGSDLFKLILQDGSRMKLHNHEPGRLLEHLELYPHEPITYSIRFHILAIKTTGMRTAMFSMSSDPLQRCSMFSQKRNTFGFFEEYPSSEEEDS